MSKIPLLGKILVSFYCFNSRCQYKMNEIVNKFLLAGDDFMLEMHLKQQGFTYNAYSPFTKIKEGIQKFM